MFKINGYPVDDRFISLNGTVYQIRFNDVRLDYKFRFLSKDYRSNLFFKPIVIYVLPDILGDNDKNKKFLVLAIK
jgi:hypothetical protein